MKRIILGALCSLALSAIFSLPVLAQAVSVPALTTGRSVTITTGTTFQTVIAAGNYRSLTIQNNNTNTDNCWVYVVNTGSPTTANSILLTPGAAYTRYFPYIPNGAIQATCATTADTLYADTQ